MQVDWNAKPLRLLRSGEQMFFEAQQVWSSSYTKIKHKLMILSHVQFHSLRNDVGGYNSRQLKEFIRLSLDYGFQFKTIDQYVTESRSSQMSSEKMTFRDLSFPIFGMGVGVTLIFFKRKKLFRLFSKITSCFAYLV